MWTDTTYEHHSRKGLALPTDLRDAEWALLETFFPPPSLVGPPRKWPMRIIEATFSLLRGGRPWRMLPPCFPPASTVRYWFCLGMAGLCGFPPRVDQIAFSIGIKYVALSFIDFLSASYRKAISNASLMVKTPSGADKYWELSQCLKHARSPGEQGTKDNLTFLLDLRHEIEHRSTNRIDDT